MLRIFIVLLGLSILAQHDARGESGENYLPNPGFEEGMKFWVPGTEGNGDVTLDNAVSHSGSHSLRLEYRKDADSRLGSYLYASNQICRCSQTGPRSTRFPVGSRLPAFRRARVVP